MSEFYTCDVLSYGTVLFRPSGKDFAFLQGDSENTFLAEADAIGKLHFPYGVYPSYEACLSRLISDYDIS